MLPAHFWPYQRCEKHCLEFWASQTMWGTALPFVGNKCMCIWLYLKTVSNTEQISNINTCTVVLIQIHGMYVYKYVFGPNPWCRCRIRVHYLIYHLNNDYLIYNGKCLPFLLVGEHPGGGIVDITQSILISFILFLFAYSLVPLEESPVLQVNVSG